MLIYLAGLKGVDATPARGGGGRRGQRGARPSSTSIFPVMRPINMIVHRHRGDRVAARLRPRLGHQQGPQRARGHRALVAQNVIGEATRYGFGSALAVIMMLISSVFITIYLRNVFREERER